MAKNHDLDWANKEVFTTGEAAEICKVSLQTIIRCFDTGRLQGFRVPGSRFRRIPRSELLRFLETNHIPTDALESPLKRVLVAGIDGRLLGALRARLDGDAGVTIETASSAYDAGLLTGRFEPHVLVLGDLPHLAHREVCERLRSSRDLKQTKVVIISEPLGEGEAKALRRSGANLVIEKPFETGDLIERIEALLEG